MREKNTNLKISDRINLLQQFYENLERWFEEDSSYTNKKSLRSYLNKNLVAVKSAVKEAGTLGTITLDKNGRINPFDNLFRFDDDPMDSLHNDLLKTLIVKKAIDQIEQAIGVYEHIQSESGLIELNPKEAIDVESAIERALRPSFRDVQPKSEKEVQDAIENILNALGIEFTRERDVTSVGGKYYKPDFVVESLDLAIEVKLAKAGNGVAKIQEDLNADISGYKTKWKNLLFVIYDLGVIQDPYKFQMENIKLFGISVRVIKH